MMPDLASGVQQSPTIIEIRPYRGGGQCFEAAGNTVPVPQGSRASGVTGCRGVPCHCRPATLKPWFTVAGQQGFRANEL